MYSDQGNDIGGNYFSGGGFMPSQSTAAPSDTQYNSGARKSGAVSQSLLPVTVKQISKATQRPPDDTFLVDGQEVSNVTLVGLVSNKDEKVTDVVFMLDDGTGRIEVKRWIDLQENYDMTESSNIRNNTYLRVHGTLRSFQGKAYIHAHSTKPITDFNEITFHFLECIYVHVYNTKAQGTALPTNSSQDGDGARPSVPYAFQDGVGARTNTPYAPQDGAGARTSTPPASNYSTPSNVPAINSSFDDYHKRVQMIFEDPKNLSFVEGLKVVEVVSQLPGFDEKRVREAIEFLVNEGLVYSTIDDDHYKSIKCP